MPTGKKKKTLSLSAAIMLIISSFTIIVSGVLGTVLSFQSINKMKAMVENKTLEMATTAAALLDGNSLKDIQASDENTEKYQHALTTLRAFKSANGDTSGEFAYIYLVRQVAEHDYIFTIDPDEEEPTPFGSVIEETPALESAAHKVAAFDKEPFTDEWGTFYSAYAPILDSTGEVAMIVGIDVWDNWYNETVWSSSRSIIIISAISVASGILVGIIINLRISSRFKLLSKEFGELEEDVQTLIKEIKAPIASSAGENIEIKGDHQMVSLRKKIHITQKEIQDFIAYIKKQAYVDALSEVGNRGSYVLKIQQISLDSPFAVIIYDINGLKYINDNYGHDIGDKTIIAFSNILKDTFDEETIFRIGGDEFVVVLTDNDKGITLQIFDSVIKKIEKFNELKELPHELSVSKGVAFFDMKKDKSYSDVFIRADENMYEDKEEFYQKNPTLKKKYRH